MSFSEILTGALSCFWMIYGAIKFSVDPNKHKSKRMLWSILGIVCSLLLLISAITQNTPITIIFYIALTLSTLCILFTELLYRRNKG